MRYVALAGLAVALVAGCARQPSMGVHAAGAPATATYRSPDGAFSFEYPRGWHVEDHWPSAMSFVTSFALGSRCCDMTPDDVKVDFQAMTPPEARSAALTFSQRCRGAFGERVVSCRTVDVNGVSWGWVETNMPGYGRSLYALAEHGGRSFAAIAFTGDPSAGLDAARVIFRTFRVA